MSTLLEHASEPYIAGMSYFTPTPERPYVIALVEGSQDCTFWKGVFAKYEAKYQVRVKTNHDANPEGSDGKGNVLGSVTPSKGNPLCVDADYDLLIDNYSLYTEEVRSNPFVFNTIYYSLENILLQYGHVEKVMSGLQLDRDSLIKFEEFMRAYSLAIYNCLVDYLVGIQDIIDSRKDRKQLHGLRNEFHKEINGINVLISNFQSVCPAYQASYVVHSSKEMYDEIKRRLEDLGIHPDDCFKVIRGHYLMNFTAPILVTLLSGCRKKLFLKARIQQPTLTMKEFNAALGDLKMTDLIKVKLRETQVDEVCVPIQLRQRLDAVYG
jgi:hypothetical protein